MSDEARCLLQAQHTTSKILAYDSEYNWCNIHHGLQIIDHWLDPHVTWMEATYGSHSWEEALASATRYIMVSQRLAFIAVSVVTNCYVLYMHFTVPAHPKYSVLATSRWCLRVHILAGAAEVVLPLVAFCTLHNDLGNAIIWATLFFELLHMLTALRMTPNVFGTRAVSR
jgi:hypothetical protein